MPDVVVLETPRLALRHMTTSDASFILELLNEPSFLRYIGDRKVRTLDDARRYILEGPMASYARFGFGLFLVELKADKISIGICGLLKREALADVDLGFAFLPRYWSQGYARESAAAVLEYGRKALGKNRIVAITSPDNVASGRLLEKLTFRFERMIQMTPAEPEIRLFAWNAS
jgi:RimJ/RimL family protein N-acetyltransferase